MKTLGEILRLSIDHVTAKGGRPRHEVEECIAAILGLKRLQLYLSFDRPLEENEIVRIRPSIARLARGEPLAYVQQSACFYGITYTVSPDVLIPRPETEVLVSVATAFLEQQSSPGTIFDICTGSGCIGLTLKSLFPAWHVVLSDISEKALSVARGNAERLNLDVEILQGNLLVPFGNRTASCLVANPPYLSTDEWNHLDVSVKNYEPRCALEGGPTGLECYRALLEGLPRHLNSPGLALFEISPQLSNLLSLARQVARSEVIKDLAGRERILAVHKT